MTIYQDVQDRLTEEVLAEVSQQRYSDTRTASLVLADNAGNEPLLGIQYQCDFRAEEESGAGELSEVFTRASNPEKFFMAQEYLNMSEKNTLLTGVTQADLVVEHEDYVGFTTSPHQSTREFPAAISYLESAEVWSNELSNERWAYSRLSVDELKAEAKSRNLKGYSKLRKPQLVQFLLTADLVARAEAGGNKEVISQPGWFHYGDILIFKKTDNLFGVVLQRLIEAAQAGALVVGSGGIGFGSGFSFFDARDLSEAKRLEISENNSWYREQMKALEPVAAVVNEGPMKSTWGNAYYFLGKPSKNADGAVRYWLNGKSVRFPNGRSVQPFGWYTLQELLDEKYMEDAAVASDANFKEFNDQGDYRTNKLTDEEVEAELKARGLKLASKSMSA